MLIFTVLYCTFVMPRFCPERTSEKAALAAFMTPMPTAAVPYMMAYGGYRQRDLFRGSWLFVALGWRPALPPAHLRQRAQGTGRSR